MMEKSMTPPTKRKQLSLQEKMNLIKQHDARRGGDGKVNLSKLALEHNIPVSSLQTIIKNRDKIMNEVEEGTAWARGGHILGGITREMRRERRPSGHSRR